MNTRTAGVKNLIINTNLKLDYHKFKIHTSKQSDSNIKPKADGSGGIKYHKINPEHVKFPSVGVPIRQKRSQNNTISNASTDMDGRTVSKRDFGSLAKKLKSHNLIAFDSNILGSKLGLITLLAGGRVDKHISYIKQEDESEPVGCKNTNINQTPKQHNINTSRSLNMNQLGSFINNIGKNRRNAEATETLPSTRKRTIANSMSLVSNASTINRLMVDSTVDLDGPEEMHFFNVAVVRNNKRMAYRFESASIDVTDDYQADLYL
jgi:hypothetical protein